jgi:hypothetical protein
MKLLGWLVQLHTAEQALQQLAGSGGHYDDM